MKSHFIFILSLLCYFQVQAQNNSVTVGNARFTVLTPHIVRMEYDSTGKFVNNRSFVVINRDLPTISFMKKQNGKLLTIKTSNMEIR